MKTKSTLRSFLTLTASTLLAVSYSHAANFTWDPANTTNGTTIDPGDGTWNTTADNVVWNDAGTNKIWAAANVAVFGGTDGTYAVTVGGSFSAEKMQFANSGYTLSAATAQTVSLTATAGGANLPQLAITTGKSATIGSNVSVLGGITCYIGAANGNAGGTLNIDGGTVGMSNPTSSLVIDGNGTVVNVKTGGTLKLLNTGNSSGGAGIAVGQLANSNASLNVQGGSVLVNNSGTGAFYVGNQGRGTVTLTSGTINVLSTASNGVTFGNTTTTGNNVLNLDGGTLTAPFFKKGVGAATATFNFNSGTLRANATNATFMQGLTTANVKAGGAIIDTQAFDITIAQALLDGTGGGGLTKNGSGDLILAGANTYNGATTVNAGTLKLSSAATNASNVTVSSGAAGAFVAVADGQHISAGSLTLNNSSKLAIDYGTTAPSTTTAPLQVVDFTLGTGIGTQIEGATPPTVGPVYPLVKWTGTGPTDTSAFGSVVLPGLIGTLSVDVPNKTLSVTYALPVEKSWNTGNGTWDTTTANWSPSPYNDGDLAIFGDAPSAGVNPVVTLNSALTPSAVTMTSTSRNYTISGTGSIGGAAGLTLDASNTQTHTLVTANTYTGPTAINGGTLRLGDGGDIGSLSATSAISVASGATFAVNQSDTITQGTEFGAISGDGGFAQTGAGTTALNLANTFTGGLKVKGGTVVLSNNAAAGTGTISVDTGGATNAAVHFSGALTVANPISVTSGSTGANTLSHVGTGALVLNGAITINSGTTLTVDSSSNNSSLDLGTGLITGDGSLVATGTSTGSFAFKGASTYTGGTTLGGAGLYIPIVSSTGSGAGTTDGVFGTGTLTVGNISIRSTNTADTTIGNTLIIDGNLTVPNATSEKTLTFSGPATLTGNRAISSSVTAAGKSLAFSGVISDGGNSYGITKSGAGVLLLNGANTYGGATVVNNGTLAITHNDALGSTAGATTINGGNGINSVILSLTDATSGLTLAEPLNFFAGTAGRARMSNNSNQNHTLTGPINVSSDVQSVNFWSDVNGSYTITGDITGTMTNGASFSLRGTSANALNRVMGRLNLTGGNFTKTDAGTWLVGAPGKTYSWVDTTVALGTLKMGLANVLPSSTTLTLGNATGSSNPTLDLNGFNQTVGGIIYSGAPGTTGTRTITNSDLVTPAVLTVNNATDCSPTAGTLANSVALTGNLSLTKQGVGTLTFSGAITYSGNTTVSEGILAFAPASAPDPANANTGNDLSIVTIADTGATLNLAFTGTDKVDKLFIGGTPKAAGVYGALLSGAQFEIAQITGTGTLTVTTGPVASYAAWALTNASGEDPELDSDKDGVENGVEFFMNAPAGFTANPQLNGTNTITWPNGGNIPASAYGTRFVIQTSPNLSTWTDVPVGSLTTNTDGPGGSLTYTLTGSSPQFVRLEVTPN